MFKVTAICGVETIAYACTEIETVICLYIISQFKRHTTKSRRMRSQLLFYEFTVIDYFLLKAFLWTLLSLLFLSAQLQDY